jgi:hypothetical protein
VLWQEARPKAGKLLHQRWSVGSLTHWWPLPPTYATMPMPPTAAQEYRVRLDAPHAARDALAATDVRLAYARLATFFLGVPLALLAWRSAIGFWWLLAPVAGFVWLIRRHDCVLRGRELAIMGIGFYERGLARLEDRWIGTGEPGERFRDDRHVYANDMDLFGRGFSLRTAVAGANPDGRGHAGGMARGASGSTRDSGAPGSGRGARLCAGSA